MKYLSFRLYLRSAGSFLFNGSVFLLMSILFLSCQKEENLTGYTPSLVIDGRIESGGYPRVAITRNIPYYANIDSADMLKLVIRQAKVTVSDGTSSEILTLKYDENVFPPFYYEGNELSGEAGKTYTLTVEWGTTVLTATTTIPAPIKPDSVWFEPLADNPEKGKVCVKLRDNAAENNYYKMFTRIVGQQYEFVPTLISNFDDKAFNGNTFIFSLNKGPESYINMTGNDFYFNRKDSIWVKVCTLDKQHFSFWRSYQQEIANSGNPFASSFHTIESNIKGDGLGVWGGFGTYSTKIGKGQK